MGTVPHELALGGIFLPPLLVAGVLGAIAASVAASWMNRFRLSKYFFYPPLVFVAMAVLFTVLIGTTLLAV